MEVYVLVSRYFIFISSSIAKMELVSRRNEMSFQIMEMRKMYLMAN